MTHKTWQGDLGKTWFSHRATEEGPEMQGRVRPMAGMTPPPTMVSDNVARAGQVGQLHVPIRISTAPITQNLAANEINLMGG